MEHDNNRDFFMANQPETEAMNRLMYREWYPLIVYNHHQTGPEGTVIFTPPFRDPFNYNFDPMIATDIDLIGAAMHDRFAREHKPGVVMRSGATYSTWWNGGLRTAPYFHNMIGLLTETIGSPTPEKIPFVPAMSLPRGDDPNGAGPDFYINMRDNLALDRKPDDTANKTGFAVFGEVTEASRPVLQAINEVPVGGGKGPFAASEPQTPIVITKVSVVGDPPPRPAAKPAAAKPAAAKPAAKKTR